MNFDKLNISQMNRQVNVEEIDRVVQWKELPQCYLKLVEIVNGFVERSGIKIYSINEIKERNETFEVNKYLPGYVAIGDDSGGNLLLMKACFSAKNVYISDCGSLFLDESTDLITSDFMDWIENGCIIEYENEEIGTDTCKVLLVGMPKGGAKDLLRLKKTFNCNISTKEMLSAARNDSLVLADNITISKARVLLKKLDDIAEYIQIK